MVFARSFSKKRLSSLYLGRRKSCAEIADVFKCSQNKVVYWLNRYGIPKRSISEAIYAKCNPGGDPFKIIKPRTIQEAKLFGLGLGLYWGEGTKSNRSSVRLGNTDPKLVKKFIEFLVRIYGIDKRKLKFGLQIFSDISPSVALRFWSKELNVSRASFQKPVVTISGSLGTYRNKSEYGVLTIYYNNRKLRDIICSEVENIAKTCLDSSAG